MYHSLFILSSFNGHLSCFHDFGYTCLAMEAGLKLWIQDGYLELVAPHTEVTITKGLCRPKTLTSLGMA